MSSAATVTDLGEQGVIDLLAHYCPTTGEGGGLGMGDDAAVVAGGGWVVTTDMVVESTHFDWRYSSPADVGHKALAVNLSDVAAMGATPGPFFLTLGLPAGAAVAALEGFAAALGALAAASGAWLAGGDTVASPAGWVVSICLLGRPVGEPVQRAGARIGDSLWVSGTLGGAAGGLRWLAEGGSPEGQAGLVARHRRPAARLALGAWLAREGRVSAMLDLSDGLATDGPRLAAASGVGLAIDLDTLPVDPMLEPLFGSSAALGLALTGGEDFELLFTVPPTARPWLAAAPTPVSCIGRVTAAGVVWTAGGRPVAAPTPVDHHFPRRSRHE